MENRSRFEELFAEQFDTVLGFLLARAEPEVAKDVAAETFLAAWRSFPDLPAEPRAWLLAVARRKLVDAYRSRNRRDALAERLGGPVPVGPVDPADAVTDRAVVRAAFGRLSPADREVLRLVAWDGLAAAEAAEVLGCSRALYAVRLHRARRRLRAELAAETTPATPPGAPGPGGGGSGSVPVGSPSGGVPRRAPRSAATGPESAVRVTGGEPGPDRLAAFVRPSTGPAGAGSPASAVAATPMPAPDRGSGGVGLPSTSGTEL
jgi:RNA polymerase sigma-70 factor (ECF subfamily)